ncbi:MAG TPA: sigma-70 family RNA polymerase sigma factor [Armatimonadota bacterium]
MTLLRLPVAGSDTTSTPRLEMPPKASFEPVAGELAPPPVTGHSSTLREDQALLNPPVFSDEERDTLYQDFRPLVRRLTRQYGDSYEIRQDLEGEIYCRFCELLRVYDPSRGVPLRAYIVRKLISSVYTYARSQWRRQRHEVSLEGDGDQGPLSSGVDPTAEWDDGLVKQELLKALPSAIERLPHRQRQVVIWRFYESRSYEEIAEILGICQATVRSLMRHGLNNLRRQVALGKITAG